VAGLITGMHTMSFIAVVHTESRTG